MVITLGEYLTNPYGHGATMAPTSMIRDNVERALHNDYPEPVKFKTYRTDSSIIFHCKLPSRTKAGVHYDVILELDMLGIAENSRVGIARLPVRVFSNSPSFYYTYAKVFEDNDLFCTWLKKKYERKILRKDPNVRNPANIIGYERTIYTCMWLVHRKFQNRHAHVVFQDAMYVKSYKDIASGVQSQEDVEQAYAHADDTPAVKQKKAEIAARKAEREANRKTPPRHTTSANASKTVKASPNSQKSAKSQKTKKMSFMQRIKKIRH